MAMGHIYEEYYREVRDSKGKIAKIKTTCPPDFNFAYDVVDRFAQEDPDKLALVHRSAEGKETRLSFGDLKKLSDKAANAFRKLGIKKFDSVMLLLKRRYEFWISILALHKLGAIAVPTSHMVSAEDISERIAVAGTKAIICVNSESICDKVKEAIGTGDVIQIVVGDKYEDKADFNELIADESDVFERVTTSKDDSMLYYFTSGTSGAPKAVIHDYSYPIAHIFTA